MILMICILNMKISNSNKYMVWADTRIFVMGFLISLMFCLSLFWLIIHNFNAIYKITHYHLYIVLCHEILQIVNELMIEK